MLNGDVHGGKPDRDGLHLVVALADTLAHAYDKSAEPLIGVAAAVCGGPRWRFISTVPSAPIC